MSTRIAALSTRPQRVASQLGAILICCALALALGATATTSHSKLAIAGLIGVLVCWLAIKLYARDPILALIALWLIEVFNEPVSAMLGYGSTTGEAVRQADELLVLLLAALVAWRILRTKQRLPSLRFIAPGLLVLLFGALSAIVQRVPIHVAVVGAWLGLKLWLMVALTMLLPWKRQDLQRIYRLITRLGILIAVIGIADYFTHDAISRALHTSIYGFGREGVRGEAVDSIFTHPGEFSLFMSMLFGLAFARFASSRSRADLALALLFAGSVMLSLRLKGFLSLASIAAIVGTFQVFHGNRGALLVLVLGAVVVGTFYVVEGNIISQQVSKYTSTETSARARLYTTSEHIASRDFPLGAGFGRFASYASRIYYSPLYSTYGLNYVYGLSREYPVFLDDTSWPSVIGETGYGGFAAYAIGLILIFATLARRFRYAPPSLRWAPLAAICVLTAFLVDSLGDPTLFDWLATTTFAMFLAPTLVATRTDTAT